VNFKTDSKTCYPFDLSTGISGLLLQPWREQTAAHPAIVALGLRLCSSHARELAHYSASALKAKTLTYLILQATAPRASARLFKLHQRNF
jgi:hypothetical protein